MNKATTTRIQTVVDQYDLIVRELTPTRSAGIFESSVTMAQLKVLMLLGAQPETGMSELAGLLHLSLSTVSGLVEKLVENGLAARRTDDADRRQVLISLTAQGGIFLDRFQELGKDTLRALLEQLSADEVERRGQGNEHADRRCGAPQRRGKPMSRLSQLAVAQRSVTLLLAVALFIAGISAWGSLKQELLPDIDFPVITVVAPFPGAGATDVSEQVSEAHRALDPERAAADIAALHLGQLDRVDRRPVLVRHGRQSGAGDDRAERRQPGAAGGG